MMKHRMKATVALPTEQLAALPRKEMGVALFACLMILLVLSLLGISAMRMMASQGQVAAGSLGAGISYSAGVSAINAAIQVGEGDLDARTILPRTGDAPKVKCLAGLPTASVTMVDCTDSLASADARGVSKAKVTVATLNTDTDTPAQAQARLAERIRRFGSMPGTQFEYFTFSSQGSVDALDISNTQVQETFFPHL